MRILVVGSGGREHTLCWKMKQSPRVSELFCAPGNGGISEVASCVDIAVDDVDALVRFAINEQIDLTVIGPEQPLLEGIVDAFEAEGLRVFGPNARAAQVEGSKKFSKMLMDKYNIPTAKYRAFTDWAAAKTYIRDMGAPIVIKADGLAAGKGVTVAQTLEEAEEALERIMEDRVFGAAGDEVVIEECLHGQEISLMAFVSGDTVHPMVISQDHKPVFDGDFGPNTGGMGAYSPVPQINPAVVEQAIAHILYPMAKGMEAEGLNFSGVLYAGLMVTADGPKVIEFNVRFGDPETQVVLPRLKSDLIDVLLATCQGELHNVHLSWDDRAAVCVVLASGGYPGPYKNNVPIVGLPVQGGIAFHAGTKKRGSQLVTNGGRVFSVTALGDGIRQAKEAAYTALQSIQFDGVYYRCDISDKALDDATTPSVR